MPKFVDVLADIPADDIVDATDVARVLGSTVSSVSRWQAAEVSPRRAPQERLLELKAVLDLARRILRPEAALLWLRSPNPELS